MVFRFPEQAQEQGVPGVPELEFEKKKNLSRFLFLIWTDLLGIFQRKSLLVGSPN